MRINDWSSDVCSSDLLDFALAELGRIERTLFALDWLEQPDLRRACQAGLNKGEARHTLAAAIYTNRQGRFTDRSIENQEYRARSEEHTSELQSLMRLSYVVFCLKKKTKHIRGLNIYTS